MKYYAHSLQDRPETDWETITAHEERVADRCRQFLSRIDRSLEPWAECLGRWHDLGKYSPEFQSKLRGDRIQVDHSAMGAVLAARKGKEAYPLAFAIAGHHTGLANLNDEGMEFGVTGRTPLKVRLQYQKAAFENLRRRLPEPLAGLPLPAIPSWLRSTTGEAEIRRLEFFTRMIFSALVDADRLATADFYAQSQGLPPEAQELQYDPIDVLRDRLDTFVDRLARRAPASSVNAMRTEVLNACRQAAALPPGLFSLTVPTGGGKTLAAMSFALRHAACHGLDRVIVVIPFTSIIEQNAKRYREAFGIAGYDDDRNVLEHHSGLDEQKREELNREAELRRRLAAENWDAPVIVTTTVQFFESLFSDHPSRCRKLHRTAKSVIILDEVQTLRPQLLMPILDGLRELACPYGASVVLSTATPPALQSSDGWTHGLADVRPIIADPASLACAPAARRVRTEWRVGRPIPYEELAEEIRSHKQVLAVVHRRADARLLAEKLPVSGRFHLSALMCPAHRLQVIASITDALRSGNTCRVVSTQLIEAGVDIDLPVVYRALAGLDSLAQSAGRCDREGKRTEAAGVPAGQFIVFRAETLPPHGTLRKAMETTDALLAIQNDDPRLSGQLDPFNPQHCELFFRRLYEKESLDARHIQRERAALNFANVGAAFQMIDNGWARSVVVPWGEGIERAEAFRRHPTRFTSRALQPYIVQVSMQHLDLLSSRGVVEPWEDTKLYLPTALFDGLYTEEFGLAVDAESQIDPELLVV